MKNFSSIDSIIISSNKPWDHKVDLTLYQNGFYVHFIGLGDDQSSLEHTAFVHMPCEHDVFPSVNGYYPVTRHLEHSPESIKALNFTREFLSLDSTYALLQLIAESVTRHCHGEYKSSAYKVTLYQDTIEMLKQGDNKTLDWHILGARDANNPIRFNVKYAVSGQYGGKTDIKLAVFTNLNLAMRPEMALMIFNLYQPNMHLNQFHEKDRTYKISNPISKIAVELIEINKVELSDSSHVNNRVIYNHDLVAPIFKLCK